MSLKGGVHIGARALLNIDDLLPLQGILNDLLPLQGILNDLLPLQGILNDLLPLQGILTLEAINL
jgi:hypothetical protein